MNRHHAVLRIRSLPWPIRTLRHLRGCKSHSGATSAPRAEIWWTFLIPYRCRTAHRWWAARHRLFWLPCCMCGREFGGHERDYWADRPASVPDPLNPPLHNSICPPCTRAGRGA